MKKIFFFIIFCLGSLWCFNKNWAYQSPYHMDPWYYFGYFIRFPGNASPYMIDRVPWILNGLFYVKIFGPVLGIGLMHTTMFGLITYVSYLCATKITSNKRAFLAASLLACSPSFVGANAWDYPESFSILCMTFSTLFALKTECLKNKFLNSIICGFFFGTLILTHLGYLMAIIYPVALLALFEQEKTERVLNVAKKITFFFAGCFLSYVIFFALYKCFGGPGVLLERSVGFALKASKWVKNPYLSPDWAFTAYHLIIPLFASFCTLIPIKNNIAIKKYKIAYCLLIAPFFLYRNGEMIATDFYASIFLPSSFLILAATFFSCIDKFDIKVIFLSCCLLFLFSNLQLLFPQAPKELVFSRTIIIFITFSLSAAYFFVLAYKKLIFLRHGILFFCKCFFLCVFFQNVKPQYPRIATEIVNYNGPDFYKKVANTIVEIENQFPNHIKIGFWFDNKTPSISTLEFRSIWASFHNGGKARTEFPIIRNSEMDGVDNLVVLAKSNEELDLAIPTLFNSKYNFKEIARTIVYGLSSNIYILFLRRID